MHTLQRTRRRDERMPALTSPDRSITVYRPTARAADWSTFLTQLADSSRRYVRAPAGTFDVGAGLTISRGDLHVDFRGCTLTVDTSIIKPVTISSDLAVTEHQAQGTVTGGVTNSLTIVDSGFAATVQVGDHHLVRVGVQVFDPQEPLYSVVRHVTAIEGNVVTYDEPLPKTQTVYADYDALRALTASAEDEKVGPWGDFSTPNNYFMRGLGQDHGIRVASYLTSDLTLDDMTIIYDGDEIMYGAWGLLIGCTERVIVNNYNVINPHGSGLHWYFAQKSKVNKMHVSGQGRAAPFGPSATPDSYAVAVTGWASNDCEINDLTLSATDVELCNFESGCEDIRINRGVIANIHSGTVNANPHFGAFGPGKCTFDGVSIDIAAASSRLITFVYETYIKNLIILTAAMPDTVQWDGQKGTWQEGLTWNGIEFSAPEEVDVVFTPVAPNSAIPYPEGIIMEATWTLSTRTGFSSFNLGGSDPFQNNPGELVFSATATALQIAAGTTYAQYLASLASDLIYSTSPSEVTMRVKIMRRIP